MKCHTNQETYTDLNNAIYTSCNTYFAKTYKEIIENYETSSIGLDKWKDYVTSFVLMDDRWVISCSKFLNIDPSQIQLIRMSLDGGQEVTWT